MTMGPLERFLGVAESADPLTLLDLTPETCQAQHVETALRRRLAKVLRHPEGRGAEAEIVKQRLREAADLLRDPARRGAGLHGYWCRPPPDH